VAGSWPIGWVEVVRRRIVDHISAGRGSPADHRAPRGRRRVALSSGWTASSGALGDLQRVVKSLFSLGSIAELGTGWSCSQGRNFIFGPREASTCEPCRRSPSDRARFREQKVSVEDARRWWRRSTKRGAGCALPFQRRLDGTRTLTLVINPDHVERGRRWRRSLRLVEAGRRTPDRFAVARSAGIHGVGRGRRAVRSWRYSKILSRWVARGAGSRSTSGTA